MGNIFESLFQSGENGISLATKLLDGLSSNSTLNYDTYFVKCYLKSGWEGSTGPELMRLANSLLQDKRVDRILAIIGSISEAIPPTEQTKYNYCIDLSNGVVNFFIQTALQPNPPTYQNNYDDPKRFTLFKQLFQVLFKLQAQNAIGVMLKYIGSGLDPFTSAAPLLKHLHESFGVEKLTPIASVFNEAVTFCSKSLIQKSQQKNILSKTYVLNCNCNDCNSLAAFLSSTQTNFSLRGNTYQRNHVEKQIISHSIPVDTATVRQGSPYLLSVTKGTRFQSAIANQRAEEAKLANSLTNLMIKSSNQPPTIPPPSSSSPKTSQPAKRPAQSQSSSNQPPAKQARFLDLVDD